MKRENGFYWVCWGFDIKDWTIMEFQSPLWLVPGSELYLSDIDLSQIDERRIINPNI